VKLTFHTKENQLQCNANPKSQLACKKGVRKAMPIKLILHMTNNYTEMSKFCSFQYSIVGTAAIQDHSK